MFTFAVDDCADELRAVGFSGREAVSGPCGFRRELASATIPLDGLVGRAADPRTIRCGNATITGKKSGDISIAAAMRSVKAGGAVTVKGSKIELD